MIPEYTKQAIDRFVSHGTPAGSFVMAVLENNLSQAFARADDNNAANMMDIVRYVFNEIPSPAWGSVDKVNRWHERKIAERGMVND